MLTLLRERLTLLREGRKIGDFKGDAALPRPAVDDNGNVELRGTFLAQLAGCDVAKRTHPHANLPDLLILKQQDAYDFVQ